MKVICKTEDFPFAIVHGNAILEDNGDVRLKGVYGVISKEYVIDVVDDKIGEKLIITLDKLADEHNNVLRIIESGYKTLTKKILDEVIRRKEQNEG